MVDQIEQIPKFKLNNQRWIFQMYESPSIYRDFSEYKNFFNLTSTYKLNSHFSNPYESNANMRWERNINYDYKRILHLGFLNRLTLSNQRVKKITISNAFNIQ
jgi:hypothetical protein